MIKIGLRFIYYDSSLHTFLIIIGFVFVHITFYKTSSKAYKMIVCKMIKVVEHMKITRNQCESIDLNM